MKKPIIFCDFDGTITETDNIISLMKQFAPPEWNEIKDQVLGQEISIQEGVGKMFSLLPSSLKEEIISFLKDTAVIRNGFSQFVNYTKQEGIPLYIVSGGIDFFVYPLLKGLVDEEFIYCNGSNFSGEKIQILWPNSCEGDCDNGCGCCKPTIINKLASGEEELIVIGDSITDLQAAKLGDTVFARDFLSVKMEEMGLPYHSFETFHDVINELQSREVKQ
ncbi:2-hydroxy-3-keto-5-methylthiopentenyl-1-phosphate phosphatase [Bacillus suaedaesalsae]|uniref:2-hydroxy-3-keto-5-methylthiopentenyl-1-phosphate phosphatase n=1 Tax=Bacillus suaedaesalsae TaxID=2810349 RepID=A0ABS2DKP8_9BACI|nr:2-hydroxy-3-keto-5-methylthiopentenyl-1-phosphate phosphatase [Bacillus suaedaesalsae]MBM6618101.1 2-hydroxy-3-keto-5-methylthiopentenyl-1-phosphate phosphatase [Bacillus suaedaesalsae]